MVTLVYGLTDVQTLHIHSLVVLQKVFNIQKLFFDNNKGFINFSMCNLQYFLSHSTCKTTPITLAIKFNEAVKFTAFLTKIHQILCKVWKDRIPIIPNFVIARTYNFLVCVAFHFQHKTESKNNLFNSSNSIIYLDFVPILAKLSVIFSHEEVYLPFRLRPLFLKKKNSQLSFFCII